VGFLLDYSLASQDPVRWADSDRSICRRQVFAFKAAMVHGFLLIWFSSSFGVFRQPTPIMSPKTSVVEDFLLSKALTTLSVKNPTSLAKPLLSP
jgi:hypothetical protein